MPRDVRLYALIARSSSRAVIFRRGPSRQVLLVGWDTDSDRFEGQWLKGRIFERRCDLSREGDFLLYFAASYRPPLFSWTAVSQPPYLTALALWPKGDAWGGGGQFLRRSAIALNHLDKEMALAEGFKTPKWLTVTKFGPWSGRGEDDPVWSQRLERDGWTLASGGHVVRKSFDAKVWVELDPPVIWEKRNPVWPQRYTLRMFIRGIKERNGPWYLTEHDVTSSDGPHLSLGRSEWADWSHSGDLLFARGPSIFRATVSRQGALQEAREVADFSDLSFEEREAPAEAKRWPRR
jgi:hypothetical protein